MRARTFDAEQELSARPVNPSLGPSSFIDVAPSSTVVQELLARAPDSHCQLCPSQLEISLEEFYFRYLARGEVGGLWSHRFLPLRERALHCYYISGVAAARVMASCCASQCGSLGSTLASQAFVGKRSAGFRREYVSLPSSKARMTGSTVGQLQKARCSPFQKSNGYGRREPSHVTCIAVSEEIAVEKEEETIPEVEEKSSSLTPYTFEVHQLLMELCDETSIAELQLKVGSFKLSVKRNVGKIKGATVAPPVAPPPVPSKPMVDSLPSAPAPPASTPITSAASGLISSLSKPLSSTWALLESAADEGLLFVKSPKVGYFRKGRVAKGKSGPPLVEEGQVIKEGHVVCYLEQLGTQQPVESNIGGEVVKVLWDDGEPVGYGDPLIAIRPSFPGIKKLT